MRGSQLGAVALSAVILATAAVTGARAQGAPQSAAQLELAPTPSPLPSNLPYPAYGTPAPDVAQLRPIVNVPQSITLKQAVDIAVVTSPDFASDRAAYRAIRAKYFSEKGALLPAISATGDITRDYSSTANSSQNGGPTPQPGATANSHIETSISGSITLKQLIFDGGRAIAAIKSAKEGDIAGRDTLLRDLQTLENTVAQDYFAVLESNATVQADAQLAREFQTSEDSVRATIHAGAEAQSDLAAAEFQTAKARGALVTAQGQLIVAQSTFASTLGLDADAMVVPQQSAQASPTVPTTPAYEASVVQALLQRPDYLSAQHNVTSAKDNLRYAKLGRFPTISFNASDGTAKSYPYNPNFSASGSIGAEIDVPIYDQGLTNYNVAVAASQLDQANDLLIQTKLGVESNVRSALANLISARALLVQAQSEVSSATISNSAATAQYRVGAATIVTIVTAEANLAQAETDYVSALYGVRTAEENYNFAVGISDLQL